jgi:hypothetical protein
MMYRVLALLAVIASAVAFMPASTGARRAEISMNMQSKISKALGVAAMGVALAGPIEFANADGAVSKSTVYRSRVKYGARIVDFGAAVEKGDFSALDSSKTVNAFDLFISGSNALGSTADKERASKEKAIEATILSAIKAKDAGKLKSAYAEFVKVADLKVNDETLEPPSISTDER